MAQANAAQTRDGGAVRPWRDRAARLWARLPAAWREGVRREPWLAAIFAALWICTLFPLWVPRFLPLLDLPDHIDAIAIWHRYHQPQWNYSQYYALNLIPVPYWGYFFPVHMLSYVFPIEVANKLYLSAYTLALPLSLLALARQFGRSPWLALFAFPLVFNMNFSFGFITFCAGMVVMTFALVLLDRFLQAPTRKRALALLLLTLGLYTTHVLPWMFFGVASIVLACCHGFRPRRVLAAFALELPSLLLAIYGFRRSADGTTAVQSALAYDARSEDVLHALGQVPVRLLASWPADTVSYFLLALGLVWFVLLLTARSDAADEPPPQSGFRYRLELIVALAGAAYLFLPMHLLKPVDLWMIGGRFMTVVGLYGALLPPGRIAGRRRWLLAPVVVIAVVYPIALARKWWQFDRRAAAFRRIVSHIERGSSTLTIIMGNGADDSADPQALPYLQFHAYAQYLAGGYEPWTLATGFPFYPKPEMRKPAPRWKHNETFNFDAQGVYYDYIITKAEWTNHAIFGPDDAGRAPLVLSDGDWRLYKVRHEAR